MSDATEMYQRLLDLDDAANAALAATGDVEAFRARNREMVPLWDEYSKLTQQPIPALPEHRYQAALARALSGRGRVLVDVVCSACQSERINIRGTVVAEIVQVLGSKLGPVFVSRPIPLPELNFVVTNAKKARDNGPHVPEDEYPSGGIAVLLGVPPEGRPGYGKELTCSCAVHGRLAVEEGDAQRAAALASVSRAPKRRVLACRA